MTFGLLGNFYSTSKDGTTAGLLLDMDTGGMGVGKNDVKVTSFIDEALIQS